MLPTIETARLVLRAPAETDADLLVELDSDPDVMHYINGGRPTPREEIVDDVLPAFLRYSAAPTGYGFWMAETDGVFIGWFHLRPNRDRPDEGPELGYRLVKTAWGQGYAAEGSRALIDYAFSELGADRVYAHTMAVHTGSRRVMEKAGLRYVRTFFEEWPDPIEGDEHGDVEYALNRSDWLSQD